MRKYPLLASLLALLLLPAAHAENSQQSPAASYDLLSDAVAPGLGATLSYDIPPPVVEAQPAASNTDIPQVNAPAYNRQMAAAFSKLVARIAHEQHLDPQLLHSIITVESGYNPGAVSPKGAIGLMQLMPGTASRFGASNPQDPVQNIRAGARYVRFLLALFNSDMSLVLAAYNAGEGAVSKYRNTIPPYEETREYVAKVLASYQKRTGQSLLPAQYQRVKLVLSSDTPL
ncbi:lytic transglycosylase domain-containing protein [Vogesella sp. LIG4]|uniref:lytic transglycosylase domain-containing protein n=1 Tax=Vogesella sp. LIG4 TaxID=1192162 RepID=UPI00081FE323|nr:lytic transglycosylase domain-containing protein [Vogesella sp. LIG4]SCK11952.1 Soluble lytic murein transglycosylase [Vogesella sp. LIG4]